MLRYKHLFIFASFTVLFAQYWQPYHHQELLQNYNMNFDYQETDNLAKLIDKNINTRTELTHKVIGYLPYWEYSHYPEFDFDLLSEINFFSAELNEYGNIVNSHNWENLSLVDYAHERGVKVKLCATLFGQSQLTTLLSDSLYRDNAIYNLLDLVILKNADGVDIDFELLPYSQRDNLVLFMEELSTAFHNSVDNPIITMATPAVDWSGAWDYNALAELTDGLFIMGYNYFYSGSSNAGPVSPLGNYYYDLEYTINDYIEKTNGQVDKLVLGLPYYGYDWPVENSSINSETTGLGNSRIYSSAEELSYTYGYNFDESSNAPWFSYEENNNWQQCWYDDAFSLDIKYQFVKDNNLQGVGIWALGYDSGHEELWDVLYDNFIFFILGDINYDDIVNVIDVILLVNMILDNENINLDADLNYDDNISILDVIVLINIILNN